MICVLLRPGDNRPGGPLGLVRSKDQSIQKVEVVVFFFYSFGLSKKKKVVRIRDANSAGQRCFYSAIRSVQTVSPTATATSTTAAAAATTARAQTAVLRGAPTRVGPVVSGPRVAGPRHQQRVAALGSIFRRRGCRSSRHGQNRIRLATRRAQLFRTSEIES